MYGIMYNALSEMIVKGFGEDKWKQVMKEADIELGGGSFLIHRHYKDDIMTRLLNSAAKILELPYDELVERYGEHFFKHCLECGYERLLRVLGRNLYDFLCNLDALHDHLTSIYPGMRAPSFRCYLGDDGSMTLRYYSDRKGLERMVSGIIKAVAREFFDTKVNVTLTSRKGKRQDHTVFHVREDSFTTILVRKRSSSLVSILHRAKSSTNPRDLPLSVMSFCKAFPFHLIIDRHFQIVQAGAALCRVLRTYRKKTKKLMFDKVFQVVRPVLNSLNFETLLDHINTVVIAVTRPGVIDESKSTSTESAGGGHSNSRTKDHVISGAGAEASSAQVLRLKGQMVFVPETDTILYLCSPRVTDVDELRERGLYLSDIPIHDATRDLILITQARRAERELVETLEETSNNLKKLQCKLREDKGRTDELLNSLLPSAIAERLRLNQAVEAEKYNLVTILFSDIVGFTAMCGNEKVVPMDIVRLLNRLYTHFDVLSNVHDVYKVETIGDAYMVVGGMPEFTESHADQVTSMAFDMMDVAQTVFSPVHSSPIQIRIGVHSGPCVAGVVGQKMPRYCLFGQTVAVASNMENSSMPGKVNISHVARGYLSNEAMYEFEENTTREDLPTECCFIRPKHYAPRPVSMDLGVPPPRGMFRTPNPSPTTSRGASPVDGASPASSPLRLNSPEGTLSKFKMPSIHICDADEEDFRSNLQAKMNQVADTMATACSAEPSGTPVCLPDQNPADPEPVAPVNTACTMSFMEHLFGDQTDSPVPPTETSVTASTTSTAPTVTSPPIAKSPTIATPSTTTGRFLFEAARTDDVDVGVRRHSHQPTSGSAHAGTLDGQLAKSVTLSDMTDPQATQVLVVSLESPSSVSSVSEADDLSLAASSRPASAATTIGSPPSPSVPPPTSRMCQGSPPEVRGVSRWCVPCTSASPTEPGEQSVAYGNYTQQPQSTVADRDGCNSTGTAANDGTAGHGSVRRTQSERAGRVLSRRRSEPAKHIDLSKIVDLNLPRANVDDSPDLTAPRRLDSAAYTTRGSASPSKRRPQKTLGAEASNGNVKKEMTLSEGAGGTGRVDRHAGGKADHDIPKKTAPSPPALLLHTNRSQSEPASPTPTDGRTARERLQAPRGPLQNFQRERLSKADLKRIKENGRLVIYFKGRPRSMSPSLRLRPLTVPEGSRSLHDSPFSSPRLTQKLNCLQGELTGQGEQDTFFRHVRLKRRDLNL